jgi:predicted nucleic acid-binding protein
MTIVTGPTGSELLLVDSSGWLEYLTDDSKAGDFAPYIESEAPLLVPTIVLYEVFKMLSRERGKTAADGFVSEAFRRIIVPLDENLALAAAHVSLELRLAMADAIIYATAQASQAQLITGDLAFRDLPGVIIP